MIKLLSLLVVLALGILGDRIVKTSIKDVPPPSLVSKQHVTINDIRYSLVEGGADDNDETVGIENSPLFFASSAPLPPPWHLDRVDQAFGQDGTYDQVTEDGTGVDIYIIDTGVQGNHPAFWSGQIQPGYNAITNTTGAGNTDCNGHGTHVAGLAGGNPYGIARGSTIFPVIFFDCNGNGNLMNFITAVAWVHEMIASRPSNPAIINLSIQAGANPTIDELVRSLVGIGAVVVVAAGNMGGDACNYSPAREPLAVTVGATAPDDTQHYSSNFGSCVDLYAPGENILSSIPVSTEGYKSGTSMACPIVVGAAATAWQRYPSFTNTEITDYVIDTLAVPLETPDVRLGCGTILGNVQFVQTLYAPTRPTGTTNRSVFLPATSDFLYWAPEMEFNGCVRFRAQTSDNINLLLSTDVLSGGIVGFEGTPVTCKEATTRYYEVFGGSGVIADTNGNQLAVTGSGTETTGPGQYYVLVMNQTIEFGSGNNDTLFFGEVTTEIMPDFKFLSFAGSNVFTNIQSCAVSAPAPAPVSVVTSKTYSWVGGPSSCIAFQVNQSLNGLNVAYGGGGGSWRVHFFKRRVQLFKKGQKKPLMSRRYVPGGELSVRIVSSPMIEVWIKQKRILSHGVILHAEEEQNQSYGFSSSTPKRVNNITSCNGE